MPADRRPEPRAPEPLAPEALCATCDPAAFDFATTESLAPLETVPGQDRALGAIRMAAEIGHSDFNVFVLGRPGSGRHSAARQILDIAATARPAPRDWVYVNNFDAPHRPVAMSLPSGRAAELKHAMERLVDDLANDIPAIFESDDYQTRRRAIEESFSEAHEEAMTALAERARERGVAILRTPMGFGVAAMREGEVLTPDGYRELPEAEQAKIDADVAAIQSELEAILKEVPRQQKEQRRRVEELNSEMAKAGVDASIAEALAGFADLPEVARYIEAVRRDMIDNAELFLIREDGARAGAFPVATTKYYARPQFQRYTVNVMVSNDPGGGGAPVVEEDLPTLGNVIGRVEHASEMGTLVTNFTMIRPGALHRANGGYLLLDARQILMEPYAWDALKRCLRTGEVQVSSLAERMSLVSTVSLEPDPIQLDLRVVLVGDRLLYYLLSALDPEFPTLFKLQADFDDRMVRDAEGTALYARLAGTLAARHGLRPLKAGGVARLLLEGTRLADDAERLSLDLGKLSDILREADHWAGKRGASAVSAEDVETAIAEAERRAGRIRELGQEAIARGTVLIDTEGAHVGQINALSVVEIGGHRFGRPSRVTARVRVGAGKLVDIEREVELGGPLHSKGVMILSGYLAAHYAPELPMSLWASVVFEQSYGGVDGDSASAAECFALLSALAEVPIAQSWAVTGSINQFGDIQAIGGVNEKIEGYFDTCAARGLNGKQGVLIPEANVKHLALRPRVVEAVRDGRFRVVAIRGVDEGMALLTGREAGARGADGRYPEGSVNRLVEDRLAAFAETRRAFALKPGGEGARRE
jgi:predicted ATP-dependent protease